MDLLLCLHPRRGPDVSGVYEAGPVPDEHVHVRHLPVGLSGHGPAEPDAARHLGLFLLRHLQHCLLYTSGTEEPEEPAEETPAEEELEDEEAPLASGDEGEEIADEEAPLAAPAGAAWALLNLILAILTALGSVLLLIGYIGKKKKEEEDENGENVEYTVKKKGVWRVLSLIPGIGAIVAFILTENMRNPMVFTDRWTLLMVIIAVIQVIVAILAKKEKEEPDDREAQA